MKYRVFPDRLKLLESHLIPKAKMGRELDKIRNLHPTCRLWKRSDKNIIREWGAHNLAYALGINRAKTKDADLDYEPKWYHNLAYWVIGNIALLVIK